MDASSSSIASSSSSGDTNPLHDIILNYVETSGYSSTARILSKSRPRQYSSEVDIEPTTQEDPTDNNGDGEESMDIDEDQSEIQKENHDPQEEGGISSKKAGKLPIKKGIEFSEDDLENFERRRAILDHILNGSISKAVDLLNDHFPKVLDESLASSSSSTATITNGHSLSSTQHLSSTYHHRNPSSLSSTSNHSVPVLYKSTNPSHVKLNLQIQQFIESFRQLNPSSSSPSSPSSSIGSLGNSGTLSNPSNSTINLTHALTAAQGLHSEAKKLPAEIRAIYLQEIKDVGALFAYTNPENSILKGFLDQERRIKLMEMVNAAILKSQNKSPQSVLEALARRTTALYKIMNDHGIDPKPNWTNMDSKSNEHLAEYWKHTNGKLFNLHDFVNSTW